METSEVIFSFSGQPFPVLYHPQDKEVHFHICMERLVFQFLPIALSVAGHH